MLPFLRNHAQSSTRWCSDGLNAFHRIVISKKVQNSYAVHPLCNHNEWIQVQIWFSFGSNLWYWLITTWCASTRLLCIDCHVSLTTGFPPRPWLFYRSGFLWLLSLTFAKHSSNPTIFISAYSVSIVSPHPIRLLSAIPGFIVPFMMLPDLLAELNWHLADSGFAICAIGVGNTVGRLVASELLDFVQSQSKNIIMLCADTVLFRESHLAFNIYCSVTDVTKTQIRIFQSCLKWHLVSHFEAPVDSENFTQHPISRFLSIDQQTFGHWLSRQLLGVCDLHPLEFFSTSAFQIVSHQSHLIYERRWLEGCISFDVPRANLDGQIVSVCFTVCNSTKLLYSADDI